MTRFAEDNVDNQKQLALHFDFCLHSTFKIPFQCTTILVQTVEEDFDNGNLAFCSLLSSRCFYEKFLGSLILIMFFC